MIMRVTEVDLSIIIVNWNTRELLAECLKSLAGEIAQPASSTTPVLIDRLSASTTAVAHDFLPRQGFTRQEIPRRPTALEAIVVDNASNDGSAAMVSERFAWVQLVSSEKNLGFAAGNNLAMRHATGKYLLLLNPDTIVLEGALLGLWRFLTMQPAVGIVGGQLLNADDSLQSSTGIFPSVWSELPLIKRAFRTGRNTIQIATPEGNLVGNVVDWVSGACLMIKREVVDDIGPLDEEFWLYTEETDWCFRARTAGWRVVSLPNARVYHLAKAASRQRYVVTMLHFYQSRVRFVCKHHGPRHGNIVKNIYRLKARLWRVRPQSSPLAGAYPELSIEHIREGYARLEQAMSLPMKSLLRLKW